VLGVTLYTIFHSTWCHLSQSCIWSLFLLFVAKHQFERAAWQLESFDHLLVTFRDLWPCTQHYSGFLLQCILAWLLCWLLHHILHRRHPYSHCQTGELMLTMWTFLLAPVVCWLKHTHTHFLMSGPFFLELLQVRPVPKTKLWELLCQYFLQACCPTVSSKALKVEIDAAS